MKNFDFYRNLPEFAANAQFDLGAAINEETWLILDTRQLNQPQCKSLLVEQNGRLIASEKETNRLINQFLNLQPIGLLASKATLTWLYPNQNNLSIPYVWGKFCLMPLGGYTRHSTSWLLLENLSDNNFLSADQLLLTNRSQTLQCLLKANKTNYLTNLKLTLEIKKTLQLLANFIYLQFSGPNLCSQLQRWSDNNHDYGCLKDFLTAYNLTIIQALYKVSGDSTLDQAYLKKLTADITKYLDKIN